MKWCEQASFKQNQIPICLAIIAILTTYLVKNISDTPKEARNSINVKTLCKYLCTVSWCWWRHPHLESISMSYSCICDLLGAKVAAKRKSVALKVLQIKSCGRLFLWNRLGWFGPVGQFRVQAFLILTGKSFFRSTYSCNN